VGGRPPANVCIMIHSSDLELDPVTLTSNVTGCHRGRKRKPRASYRAPDVVSMDTAPLLGHCYYFVIVECGIARFLCAMCARCRDACIRSFGIMISLATLVPNFVSVALSSPPHCEALDFNG